jgi:hypothetical protein
MHRPLRIRRIAYRPIRTRRRRRGDECRSKSLAYGRTARVLLAKKSVGGESTDAGAPGLSAERQPARR